MSATATSPAPRVNRATEERVVVVTDPRPGTIVELAAGCQLGIRFRRSLGESHWRIAETPRYLVALQQATHEFVFLVFGSDFDTEVAQTVRFERVHPDEGLIREVRELLVVPILDGISDDAGRTPTFA
jgi:hypothetical protein